MSVNDYGLFFSREDTVLRLPVNPPELPVARETENGTYNVLGIGPVMVPRTPNQRVVSISSFFPGRPFSGVLTPNSFQLPEFYIQFFESAMNDRAPIVYTPVRYYETGEPFMTGDTGFPVLVTSFHTEERGGETGDFYYDLELTEYRDWSPRSVQVLQQEAGQAVVAAAEPARDVPRGQLYAGRVCLANGAWYYTSYGDEPHGNGNGRRVVVSRIVDLSRPCPYHVTGEDGGALGWMAAASLQAVNSE